MKKVQKLGDEFVLFRYWPVKYINLADFNPAPRFCQVEFLYLILRILFFNYIEIDRLIRQGAFGIFPVDAVLQRKKQKGYE